MEWQIALTMAERFIIYVSILREFLSQICNFFFFLRKHFLGNSEEEDHII